MSEIATTEWSESRKDEVRVLEVRKRKIDNGADF